VIDILMNIPVSRWISRRPRKNFGLAAVDFAKPPDAGKKKIRPSRRFSASLFYRRSPQAISLTFSCLSTAAKVIPGMTQIKVSDGILLTKLHLSRKAFLRTIVNSFKIASFLLSQTSRISGL